MGGGKEKGRGDHRSDGGNQSGMKVADGVLQKYQVFHYYKQIWRLFGFHLLKISFRPTMKRVESRNTGRWAPVKKGGGLGNGGITPPPPPPHYASLGRDGDEGLRAPILPSFSSFTILRDAFGGRKRKRVPFHVSFFAVSVQLSFCILVKG